MPTLAEVKTRAGALFLGGDVSAALALYHAAMSAHPFDIESRLRVADCLLSLAGPEKARAAYLNVAWFAMKGGHPLTALVAARVLADAGHPAEELESGFVALYGSSAELGGPLAARLSLPPDDAEVLVPAEPPADLIDRAADDAANCLSDYEEFPEALHRVTLFSRLSQEALRRVLSTVLVRRMPKGAHVVRQGDPGESFFFVANGEVSVFSGTGDTTQQLAVLGEGAVFGEMALLRNEPRSASAEVVRDCDLLELTRASLRELASELTPVAEALNAFMHGRLVANLLGRHPMFRPFDDAQRHELLRRFISHDVEPGTEIIRKGEPGAGLFLVLSGEVEVHTTEDGSAACVLGAGEVFGEMALVRDAPTSATVVASSPTTVLFLGRENVQSMISGIPEIRQYLESLADDRALDNQLSVSAEAEGKDVIILF